MKRALLAAAMIAGLTAVGTAYGESLSGQERLLFDSDGIIPKSAAVPGKAGATERTSGSDAAVAPVRQSLSREALKVWWR